MPFISYLHSLARLLSTYYLFVLLYYAPPLPNEADLLSVDAVNSGGFARLGDEIKVMAVANTQQVLMTGVLLSPQTRVHQGHQDGGIRRRDFLQGQEEVCWTDQYTYNKNINNQYLFAPFVY